MSKPKGQIIFLNGVSSSGKTTLAKALQKKMGEPYFLLGNDLFTDEMAPEKFKEIDWPEMEYRSLALMFRTIGMFSDCGANVIADCVILSVQKNDPLRECVRVLRGHPLLFVRVDCGSTEELARREERRGDRDAGQGASQLSLLAPKDEYDLTVDTYAASADECADRIVEANVPGKLSDALARLYESFAADEERNLI